MKTTKLMSFAVTGLVLATLGGQMASAAVVENSDGTGKSNTTEEKTIIENGVNNTDTTVKIIDNTDPTDPTDPIDPTDPTQKMLVLEKVPSAYNFESKLTNGNYSIESGKVEGDPITVFNDRIDRDWSVKAFVQDNKLYTDKENKSGNFTVDSFTINGHDIITGEDSIVAKSLENKTAENNTGRLKTEVKSIGINFKDNDGALKVGQSIYGTIQYTLYNTATGE